MTTKTKKTKISLAEAEAVVSAHREAKREKDNAALRQYIGRYFKYRNSGGGADEKWWLYGNPRKVEDWGGCFGLTFQRIPTGEIHVRTNDQMSLYALHTAGWQEITAKEFWSAARVLRADLVELLSQPPA